MSKIRFLWNNLADIAALTPSSELSSLPAKNIQHPHRKLVWRTATDNLEWVEMNLGAAYTVKGVALINHNFLDDANLKMRLLGSYWNGISAPIGWGGGFWDWMYKNGKDRGDKGCDLTFVNSPTIGWNDNYGLELILNGTDQHAYRVTDDNLNLGQLDFTLVARIKTSATNAQGVIGKTAGGIGYGFYKLGSGVMRLRLTDGANAIEVDSNTVVHDGAEHTVGVVVDRTAGTAKFYFDGNPDGQGDISSVSGSLDNDGQFLLGKWSANYLNGSIAFAAVYKNKKMTDWDMGQIHSEPVIKEDLTYDSEIIIKHFTGGNKRYWRLEFDNSANPENKIDIGRMFLGNYFEPSRQFARGWEEMLVDPSKVEHSEQGQEWVDLKEKHRLIRVEFPEGAPLSETDRENYREMLQAVGCSKDIFIALDYDNQPSKWSLYGKFAQTEFNFREFLAGLYTTGFDFKENR